MKIAIMVLVGLPASGKTTLAKELSKPSPSDFHFIHICYDNIMPEIPQEGSAPNQWKEERKKILDISEKILEALLTSNISSCPREFQDICASATKSSLPIVLIIDDNMYYRSMRYSYYQLAKRYSIGFCQLYFDVPLDIALVKNSSRVNSSYVPEEVLRNINSNLEPPHSMNNWEKYSLSISPFDKNLTDVYNEIKQTLESALANPESPTILCAKETQNVSLIHVLDTALRKCVSQRIKVAKAQMNIENLKGFCDNLALVKSRILCDLKNGVISIPPEITDSVSEEKIVAFADSLVKETVPDIFPKENKVGTN